MNKIIEENLKPRTVITYIVFFSFTYLALRGMPIPEDLKNLIFVMQGFWFGSKINPAKPTEEEKKIP